MTAIDIAKMAKDRHPIMGYDLKEIEQAINQYANAKLDEAITILSNKKKDKLNLATKYDEDMEGANSSFKNRMEAYGIHESIEILTSLKSNQ